MSNETSMSNSKRGWILFGCGGAVAAAVVAVALVAAPRTPLPPFDATQLPGENERARQLEKLINGTQKMADRMAKLSEKSGDWGASDAVKAQQSAPPNSEEDPDEK